MEIKDYYYVCDYYGYRERERKKNLVPVQIYLALPNSRRKLLPPVVKIHPDGWDDEKRRVTSKCENAMLVRRQLNDYISRIEEIELQCAASKQRFTVDYLLKALEKNDSPREAEKNFLEYATDYINSQSIGVLSKRGKIRSVRKLDDFYRGLQFSQIDWKLMKDFVTWLKRSENGKRVYSDNYVARVFKDVKTVLNYARRDSNVPEITSANFPIDKENSVGFKRTKFVFLTMDELNALYALNFEKNKRLELIHARFMFSCFTGLRHSDINQLTDKNLVNTKDGYLLEIQTEKTETHLQIPLWQHFEGRAQEVLKTLQKYDYQTRGDDNYYLPELTEKAGIEKKITFHVARHSFITNLLHQGVPMVKVMFMVGINKIDTIRTYLHNTQLYYN